MRAADARLFGAMGKANAAAAAIAFAPDVTSGRGNEQRLENSQPRQRFDQFGRPLTTVSSADSNSTINININRANVDGQQIINEINNTLKTQGSRNLLR
jgi:hypothetical protein